MSGILIAASTGRFMMYLYQVCQKRKHPLQECTF